MKVSIGQEAETLPGSTTYQRFKDLIEEVRFAEEMGFHSWGTSEQHFIGPLACVSAPEVLYGAIARETSRIRLRHASILMLPEINDPVRVAERVATLDLLSDGRAELGFARGNSLVTLGAWDIDPSRTREKVIECVRLISQAMTQPTFSFDGEFIKFPERQLTPKPLQNRVPMLLTATSIDSCRNAGNLGIGVITNDNGLGWDYTQQQITAYDDGLAQSEPIAGKPYRSAVFTAFASFVSHDEDEAIERGGEAAFAFMVPVLEKLYEPLAKMSNTYDYMLDIRNTLGDIIESRDKKRFIDFSPCTIAGTPQQVVATLKRLEAMGYDEAILRIDGHSHETLMQQIELIGREVIPQLSTPEHVVPEPAAMADTNA